MPDPVALEEQRVNELALSIAWHAGLARSVVTTDGTELSIVFPGHWTHGHGPDFRNAMLEYPGGRLVSGAVELHHRASDWTQHNHHTDPAYNDVVLHIVSDANATETRSQDGTIIPTAVLTVAESQLRAVQDRNPAIWAQFGGDVCAPHLVATQPKRIRDILWHLGDERFDQRVIRFESELVSFPPTAVLVRSVFDAFGYSRNRDQMVALAERFGWSEFAHRLDHRPRADRIRLVLATLLGLGGWMPLSPAHAALTGLSPGDTTILEDIWQDDASAWHRSTLPATVWDTARVRPANHPVSRVTTLAVLLGSHGTALVSTVLGGIRDGIPTASHLQNLTRGHETPPLGKDRAVAIAASVVLPFAAAYARATGDDALEDASIHAWSQLPSGTTTQPARRARQQVGGEASIRGLKERGNQGLLYLDRQFCTPRRCYECPVARTVVADELSQPTSSA